MSPLCPSSYLHSYIGQFLLGIVGRLIQFLSHVCGPPPCPVTCGNCTLLHPVGVIIAVIDHHVPGQVHKYTFSHDSRRPCNDLPIQDPRTSGSAISITPSTIGLRS